MNKIQKTDHFYLIDGSGYIFRAYYALPPLTRKSDGLPTGAVSGFCSMLFKLLEDSKSDQNLQKPTHFAVIFDSARKTFRNEIYVLIENKSDEYFKEIIFKGLERFIDYQILQYDDFSKVDIHYVGSIAFYLKDEITRANFKTSDFSFEDWR